MGKIIICEICKNEGEHHARGLCNKCYKKGYKQPKIICKNCGKKRIHQAFGLCSTCHTKIHHYDKTKNYNYTKYHKIPIETYKKLTEKCVLCGFDKIVELHHLDMNRSNNSKKNFVGLCPNHHKILHDCRFSKEVVGILREKGYIAKESKL